MPSPCLRHKCIKCCCETQMPLSAADTRLLEDAGKSGFCAAQDGWLQLRNEGGRCVFHDGSGCTVYKERPQGCRLYPVVFNEALGKAEQDPECPHGKEFPLSGKERRAVQRLAGRLCAERAARLAEKM